MLSQFQSIPVWHTDVEYNYVRIYCVEENNALSTITRLSQYLKVLAPCQLRTQAIPEQGVVINENSAVCHIPSFDLPACNAYTVA